MQIDFTLLLPRDALSVPVVRRVVKSTMGTLGVSEECAADIEIALSEACTNVLDHADDSRDYSVVARLEGDECEIDVVDLGVGFDADAKGRSLADADAEEGRGIQLIRALVDDVHFERREDRTNVVTFRKRLSFEPGSPGAALASEESGEVEAPEPDGAVLDERDAALQEPTVA